MVIVRSDVLIEAVRERVRPLVLPCPYFPLIPCPVWTVRIPVTPPIRVAPLDTRSLLRSHVNWWASLSQIQLITYLYISASGAAGETSRRH